MKLIRTHDGVFGWQLKDKVRWFNSEYQARIYGMIHMDYDVESKSDVDSYMKEFDYAVDAMTQQNNTIAHFGIYGSFMYSTKE